MGSSGPTATGASALTGAGAAIVLTWFLSVLPYVHVAIPQDVAMILGGLLAPVVHKFLLKAGVDDEAPAPVSAPAAAAPVK